MSEAQQLPFATATLLQAASATAITCNERLCARLVLSLGFRF